MNRNVEDAHVLGVEIFYVTVFGVSTWNNGDVSGECLYLVLSAGAHCFMPVILHHLFSTSSGRRNTSSSIHTCTSSVFYVSSARFEPIQPKTRGVGDKASKPSTCRAEYISK